MRPTEINILGKIYKVTYCDNPADVDREKRQSLWGQVDYWTHSIRIYETAEFKGVDVLDSIIHEMLHVIAEELKLNLKKDERHDDLSLLAMALADVLTRNGWLVTGDRRGDEGE